MASGTYVEFYHEIKAETERILNSYFPPDVLTSEQGSLKATLTTHCSSARTEAQCNQSNPQKWKVSLERCSRPLI